MFEYLPSLKIFRKHVAHVGITRLSIYHSSALKTVRTEFLSPRLPESLIILGTTYNTNRH